MTSLKGFVASVMAKIRHRITEPGDRQIVEAALPQYFHEGFTVHEAVVFHGFMEELGCQLDEDEALRRMAELKKKVLSRKS